MEQPFIRLLKSFAYALHGLAVCTQPCASASASCGGCAAFGAAVTGMLVFVPQSPHPGAVSHADP